MIAKRGVTVEAVHFESYPYTSEQARDKVIELAREVSEYCGKIKVHIISLTHLQEVLRDSCAEEYFTLLLRRSMMRLAERDGGGLPTRCGSYHRRKPCPGGKPDDAGTLRYPLGR